MHTLLAMDMAGFMPAMFVLGWWWFCSERGLRPTQKSCRALPGLKEGSELALADPITAPVLAGLQKKKGPRLAGAMWGPFPRHAYDPYGGSVVCDCATDQETWTF